MSVYASRRQSCTARSGTRKERPTRTAESSPAWTRRYTVIFETRIIEATSATVRKLTAARGVGTVGRPTGMAAGGAGATGRALAAGGLGRPGGRGPGRPGRGGSGRSDGPPAWRPGAQGRPGGPSRRRSSGGRGDAGREVPDGRRR